MAFNLDGLSSAVPATLSATRKKAPAPLLGTSWGMKGLISALDHVGIVSITTPDGRILHVNEAFVRLSKYRRDDLIGQSHAILNSKHHTADFWRNVYETLELHGTWRGQIKNRAQDGTFYWVDALIIALKSRGRVRGYVSIQNDMTEVVALRHALQERNEILQAILDRFPGRITAFDKNRKPILFNGARRRAADNIDDGMTSGPPTAAPPSRFIVDLEKYVLGDIPHFGLSKDESERIQDTETIERQIVNGRTIEIQCTPLPHGGFLSTHRDVTELDRDLIAIEQRVQYDAVTGLPGRILFQDRVHARLAVLGDRILALHCIAVDGLGLARDKLGRAGIDQLLKLLAQRLTGMLGDSDIATRLESDDFAILQANASSIEDVETLARRLADTVAEPFVIGDLSITLVANIGIAIGPLDGSIADDLIKNAQTALVRTKSSGCETFGFFDPSRYEGSLRRLKIAQQLREAIANNEFELHYQPIINIKSRKISGCEALIRWSHPEHGLVPASEFIPIAEECGLIGHIGDWVLKTACAEARDWPDDIWVAVNISAAQFDGQTLVDKVLSFSKGLPLSRLVLEITETLLMKNRDAVAITLESLKKLGVRFSIDDFGTGFSSLSYLQSFPFDKIKIDRSFVSNTSNQKRSATLRRSVIQLGYNLGMTSVAEGVETVKQLDMLRAEGCIEAQGFLFSPAVPAAKIRNLLPVRFDY
jgi:diguanylate cyclase (GGDEF)-like protein/PAS domain S-box-containing protein